MLAKPIPLYLALILAANIGLAVGLAEYWLINRSPLTPNADALTKELTAAVLPSGGYETSLTWGDIGKKLVEAGAIDEEQYQQLYTSPADGKDELDILKGSSSKPVSIHENNAHFVLNTLWAFGLVQKSKVLDEGPMKSGDYSFMDFASTAGWTLGKKTADKLYSSQEIVSLNDFQQELVQRIAGNVYRPCCGNSTAFPDCNHGMAALGLIELEVAAGIAEDQIYRDVLAFNSFWFPETYIQLAAYFQEQGIQWEAVDPQTVLGAQYSSASGFANTASQIINPPSFDSGGGSCGV